MIPSTMRPWWISLLIDPNQDWFHPKDNDAP